jgi:hypothetical protein
MARHALLVGVHAFEDARIHPLNAPDADVRAFSAVLRDPELGGFDQVELSVNEPYASIRSKIARLTANRAPDDLVLLYYSGHGVLDFDGGLHLLAANSSLDLLHEATFHSDEIKGFLDRSRSRRQVLVLDCCHAGAFVPPGHKDAGRREAVTSATFDPRGYGRVVILASSETQVVPDGTAAPEAISPFTRLLLEGLRDGEAAPEAEEISAQALAIYAETRMKRDFSGVTPRVIQDNQAGPIILARNPNAGVSRIPAEVRVALADPDWLRRGGALAHLSGLLDAGEPRVRQAARHLLQLRVGNERDIELRESLRVALEGRTLLAVEQELALCKRSCAEMRAAAVKQEHVLAARSKQIESLERELKEAKRNGAAAARLASSLRSEVAALKEAEAAAEVSTAELRKKLADTEKVLADTRGKLKQSNAELNASKAELLSGKLALLQKSVDSGEWKGLGADFLKTQHGKKLAERQGGEPTTPLKLTTQTESAGRQGRCEPDTCEFRLRLATILVPSGVYAVQTGYVLGPNLQGDLIRSCGLSQPSARRYAAEYLSRSAGPTAFRCGHRHRVLRAKRSGARDHSSLYR